MTTTMSDVYDNAIKLETLSTNENPDLKNSIIPIGVHIKQGTITSNLFCCVAITYWDNVMGPVISKLWLGNNKLNVDDAMLKYVTNHTLGKDICRSMEKQNIDPIFHVHADLGYIFFALIFNGYYSKPDQAISAAIFIMSHQDLDRFLLLHNFIHCQVKMMIMKYRVLQFKSQQQARKSFTVSLKKFVEVVDSLEGLSIPQYICIKDTFFGGSALNNELSLFDSKLLIRAITSHLQTCGSTLVIGSSKEQINLMIRTLGLFLSPNEKYCSRLATSEPAFFCRDLFLQGILKQAGNSVAILSEDILLNTYPTTIVDMDKKSVKQTPLLNEHNSRRRELLKDELSLLLKDLRLPEVSLSSLFNAEYKDISILVQELVNKLFEVPEKCSFRRTLIKLFMELIEQQAKAMISYVKDESNNGRLFMRYTHVQQMKITLSFKSEADFRVVLAAAEKLRPGLAIFLLNEIYKEDENYKKILETL